MLIHRQRSIKMILALVIAFICISTISGIVHASVTNNYYYKNQLIYSVVPQVGVIQFKYDRNGNLIEKKVDNNMIVNPGFEYESLGWNVGLSMYVQKNIVKFILALKLEFSKPQRNHLLRSFMASFFVPGVRTLRKFETPLDKIVI